jgi:hypothetical protein
MRQRPLDWAVPVADLGQRTVQTVLIAFSVVPTGCLAGSLVVGSEGQHGGVSSY